MRVGTAHASQGGEHDVVVLSLVAGSNQPPRTFDVGDIELGVMVNGHRADAVVRDRTGHLRPVLRLDTGPPGPDDDPARHLWRALQRTALLGDRAVRVPAWRLFTDPAWLRAREWPVVVPLRDPRSAQSATLSTWPSPSAAARGQRLDARAAEYGVQPLSDCP